MSSEISRRGFLTGAAGVAGLAATGAVMMQGATSAMADEAPAEAEGEAPNPTDELETDILIVGCGAAGIFAAYEAGKAQAGKVLVISNSPDSQTTNGGNVSGTCAVETPYTDEVGQDYTSQQLFEQLYDYSHYTINANLLRTCVYYMPENIEIFNEMGIDFTLGGDRVGIGFQDVHLFATDDKNTLMQHYIEDNFGVEFMFNLNATAPIMDGDAIAGISAEDADGNTITIKAKAVILTCGGFLCDTEQVEEKFGVTIVPFCYNYQNGNGITIAEQAGAFREAQISLGMTDIVAATEKVGFTFDNQLLMTAYFGNLLVDHRGKRFMNEFELANEQMTIGGEALLHVKQYYALYSQSVIDAMKTQGYYDYIGEPACWPTGSMLYTMPISNIDELLEDAIELGWVFKADTIEELAEMENLPYLVETVQAYNEMVASGVDDVFGKPIEMAEAISEEGPYYLLQFNAGAFNTFGGCRTDENTRALNKDFEAIPGLYIAGVENGSLYSRPYYFVGGTCSGLAYSSGRIAGQQAAAYVAAQ